MESRKNINVGRGVKRLRLDVIHKNVFIFSRMRKVLVKISLLLLMSVVAWLCFNTYDIYKAEIWEQGVYFAYTKSLLLQGDFNTLKFVPPPNGWIASTTMNYPDYHDHGVALLWLPVVVFSFLAKAIGIDSFHGTRTMLESESLSFSLSVFAAQVILFVWTLGILYYFCRPLLKSKLSKFIFWTFPFFTPVAYYTFIEYGNADIAAFFMASLLLYVGERKKFERVKDYFFWGMLLSIARVIKISFLFWIPYGLFILGKNLFQESDPRQRKLGVGAFAAAVLSVFGLNAINTYLEFGFFSFLTGNDYDSEFSPLSLFDSIWKNIFGPFGLIHQAPWLLAVLLSWLYSLRQSLTVHRDRTLFLSQFILGFGVIAKFIYLSTSIFESQYEFGFRQFINDIPAAIWVVIYATFYLNKNFKNSKYFIFPIQAILLGWAAYYLGWFMDINYRFSIDTGIFGIFKIGTIGDPILGWKSFLNLQKMMRMPLGQSVIVVCFLFFLFLIFSFEFSEIRFQKIRRNVPWLLFVGYLVATILNCKNNSINASELIRSHKFDKVVVANGMRMFMYDEIARGQFPLSMEMAKALHNRGEFDYLAGQLKVYLSKAPEQIERGQSIFYDEHFVTNDTSPKNGEVIFLNYDTPSVYDQAFLQYCTDDELIAMESLLDTYPTRVEKFFEDICLKDLLSSCKNGNVGESMFCADEVFGRALPTIERAHGCIIAAMLSSKAGDRHQQLELLKTACEHRNQFACVKLGEVAPDELIQEAHKKCDAGNDYSCIVLAQDALKTKNYNVAKTLAVRLCEDKLPWGCLERIRIQYGFD